MIPKLAGRGRGEEEGRGERGEQRGNCFSSKRAENLEGEPGKAFKGKPEKKKRKEGKDDHLSRTLI